MSNKDATVKLNLDGGNYVVSLKRIGDQTKNEGDKAARAFKPLEAGLNRVKRDFGELGGKLKGLIGQAVTFGGALSAGLLVKDAVALRSELENIAFKLETATGQATSWRDVQQQIAPIAARTARSTQELAGAFSNVLTEVGDADFARAATEAIGTAATASGIEVEKLSGIAGALGDKFGITGNEINESLAAVIELANKGGASIDDMQAILNLTGASARAAGMMGEDGFRNMISLFNIGGDALGNLKKGVSAVTGLIDQMADPSTAKEIKRAFQVSTKDASGAAREATDVLGEIFAKTRGKREKLAVVFKGEQLKLVTELGKRFTEAFEAAEGDVKTKTAAGIRAYNAALEQGATTTLSFADLQKKAAERAEEPERQLTRAMERLHTAMGNPKVIAAIDKLSEKMPQLADVVGKVIDFMADHPLLAGGMALGGKAALSFTSGAITEGATQFAGEVFGSSRVKDAGEVAGRSFASKAFGTVAIAGVAAALSAAIVGAVVEWDVNRAKDKDASRIKDITEKGERAAQKAAGGEQLNANEREDLGNYNALKEGGLSAVDRLIRRRGTVMGEQQGLIQRELGFGAPALSMGEGVITGTTLEKLQAQPSAQVIAAPAPAAPQSGPIKVEITRDHREDSFARKLASYITDKEQRVRVMNLQGSPATPAARGPMNPGPPRGSGGSGGT